MKKGVKHSILTLSIIDQPHAYRDRWCRHFLTCTFLFFCQVFVDAVSRGRSLGPGPDIECVCALGSKGM